MDRCICGHSELEHGPTGECRAAGCRCRHFVPEVSPRTWYGAPFREVDEHGHSRGHCKEEVVDLLRFMARQDGRA